MSEVGDLNSIDGTCFFYSAEGAGNSPSDSGGRFVGISIAVSPAWSNQFAMSLGYGIVHVRGKRNGVWEQWRKI